MKGQFQSTETLRIRLSPFIDKTTGNYIIAGTDVCTLTIVRPNGALYTGSTVTATWDSLAKIWYYDISTGSFEAGEWRVYAVTNDANGLPKWAVYYWGDYVDTIATITTVNTRIGSPVGASISADIANVDSDLAAVNTRIGAPVGASISADIAAVKADAVSILADLSDLYQLAAGRWRVQGTQLIVYGPDDVTPLLVFDLKDDAGVPSGTRVFERVPV